MWVQHGFSPHTNHVCMQGSRRDIFMVLRRHTLRAGLHTYTAGTGVVDAVRELRAWMRQHASMLSDQSMMASHNNETNDKTHNSSSHAGRNQSALSMDRSALYAEASSEDKSGLDRRDLVAAADTIECSAAGRIEQQRVDVDKWDARVGTSPVHAQRQGEDKAARRAGRSNIYVDRPGFDQSGVHMVDSGAFVGRIGMGKQGAHAERQRSSNMSGVYMDRSGAFVHSPSAWRVDDLAGPETPHEDKEGVGMPYEEDKRQTRDEDSVGTSRMPGSGGVRVRSGRQREFGAVSRNDVERAGVQSHTDMTTEKRGQSSSRGDTMHANEEGRRIKAAKVSSHSSGQWSRSRGHDAGGRQHGKHRRIEADVDVDAAWEGYAIRGRPSNVLAHRNAMETRLLEGWDALHSSGRALSALTNSSADHQNGHENSVDDKPGHGASVSAARSLLGQSDIAGGGSMYAARSEREQVYSDVDDDDMGDDDRLFMKEVASRRRHSTGTTSQDRFSRWVARDESGMRRRESAGSALGDWGYGSGSDPRHSSNFLEGRHGKASGDRYSSRASDDRYSSKISDDRYCSRDSDERYSRKSSEELYSSKASGERYSSKTSDERHSIMVADTRYSRKTSGDKHLTRRAKDEVVDMQVAGSYSQKMAQQDSTEIRRVVAGVRTVGVSLAGHSLRDEAASRRRDVRSASPPRTRPRDWSPVTRQGAASTGRGVRLEWSPSPTGDGRYFGGSTTRYNAASDERAMEGSKFTSSAHGLGAVTVSMSQGLDSFSAPSFASAVLKDEGDGVRPRVRRAERTVWPVVPERRDSKWRLPAEAHRHDGERSEWTSPAEPSSKSLDHGGPSQDETDRQRSRLRRIGESYSNLKSIEKSRMHTRWSERDDKLVALEERLRLLEDHADNSLVDIDSSSRGNRSPAGPGAHVKALGKDSSSVSRINGAASFGDDGGLGDYDSNLSYGDLSDNTSTSAGDDRLADTRDVAAKWGRREDAAVDGRTPTAARRAQATTFYT
jgi:hypothetical protein